MLEVLSILGVIALLYGRAINYGKVVDDFQAYENFKRAGTVAFRWWPPRRAIWRLHGSATVNNLKKDRIITLLIHALVCCLIFLVLGRDKASFMAAVLFAVHPVNNQVSVWLNGKRYGINAALVLLMWALGGWGVVVWCLTPLFQPSALPALFLYVWRGVWWPLLIFPLAFFVGWNKSGGWLVRWFRGRKQAAKNPELTTFALKKYVLYFKTFGYYVRHYLWPRDVFMWPKFMQYYGITKEGTAKAYEKDLDFYFGLCVWVAMASVCWIFWGQPVAFGLLWFILFISVFCNLLPLDLQTVADRYCYLPGVGLMYALGSIIDVQIFLFFAVWYASKTDVWMRIYRNMEVYHFHHIINVPDSPRAWHYIADNQIKFGGVEGPVWAYNLLKWGFKFVGDNPRLHLTAVFALAKLGQKEKALEHLNIAQRVIVSGGWRNEMGLSKEVELWREQLSPEEKKND